MPASKPITVALLAVPEVSASTLFGLYDTLRSAGRHWEMLHGDAEPAVPFRPLVVSRDGRPLQLASGPVVAPDASLADVAQAGIVCISTLEVPPDEPLDDRYAPEVAWLRERHAGGATVASACSGAVLLARTGLLEGLDATSHWAYCDALRREYPRTRWHPERTLVVSGADQRIVMAGSGISWHLLAMHLIARFAAPKQAMQVARMKLMDLNATSPVAYASLKYTGRTADPLVARCQQWAALNYAAASPVTQMVALSGIPERTFKRRFTLATGMSPLEYVHALRLEEAKQMLATGDQPVEAIALEVGYQDAAFFGRLFRRKVAMTPAKYRAHFGTLARRLSPAR
jgi:transcriptional regulator GlxA family with amidase domain